VVRGSAITKVKKKEEAKQRRNVRRAKILNCCSKSLLKSTTTKFLNISSELKPILAQTSFLYVL